MAGYAGATAFWIPDQPPTSRVGYNGAPQTIDVMRHAALDDHNHFETRQLAESVCEHVDSKDYCSEYLALYYFLLQRTRYMRDPRRTELVRAPYIVSQQILAGHRPSLDCLPEDTLLLKRGHQTVPIRDIAPGDQIWGYDRWSTVEATLRKGELPVHAISMNNGSTFFATADHKVYVYDCQQHPASWRNKAVSPCECPRSGVRRVCVSDLQSEMVLLQPERIPFGDVAMDPDRALIEGLYISDGWHQDYGFFISGQDGCPKEAQKREVVEVCNRLGVATTWYPKSVHVRDSEWARRMEMMGTRAPEKHALSIDLEEPAARELLRGIMADSGANTNGPGRTFTTTSYELFLQTRILQRMFGISCGERYVPNHGGLGKHPVWRLQTRSASRADGSRTKRVRVKDIERAVAVVPVYDIQTDDHYVYLPHADVTVSNCDDMATWIAAAILAVGGTAWFATVAFAKMMYAGQVQYSHVFPVALEPRTRKRIVLDPVAAEKTPEMLRRVQAHRLWGPIN